MTATHEVTIYYKYTHVADPAAFVAWHKALCNTLTLKGRILIAHEGINGTVEGTPESIQAYKEALLAQDGSEGTYGVFSDVWFKDSPTDGTSFPRMQIRVRSEIVSLKLGDKDLNPNEITGTHLEAKELHKMFEDGEDFTIIDMRNDYEYAVGHFKNSIDPKMVNFRELPEKIEELKAVKDKKVVTVCTYGVRCEKASGFLKAHGFENVYQLNGGIGTYMKEYPGQNFLGSLYVFDNRVLERFTDTYEVTGRCVACDVACENCTNCSLPECHRRIIACAECVDSNGFMPCSDTCKTIIESKCVPA